MDLQNILSKDRVFETRFPVIGGDALLKICFIVVKTSDNDITVSHVDR